MLNNNFAKQQSILNRKSKRPAFIIFTAVSCYFIFNSDEYMDRVIFFAISMWAFFHIKDIKFSFSRKSDAVLFAFLSFYLAFALCGKGLYIEQQHISSLYFFVTLLLSWVWAVFVTKTAIDFFMDLSYNIKPETSSKNYWTNLASLTAVIFTGFVLFQIAYNPAIISSDSFAQFSLYLGARPHDFHSAWYTILFQWFYKIFYSVTFVMCMQMFALAFVMALCLLFLHEKGLPFRYALISAAVLGILPNNGLLSITVWKDVPFSISLLWLTLTIAKYVDSRTGGKARNSYVLGAQLCLSLAFVYLFRNNGVLTVVITASVLLILFIKQKQLVLIFGVLLSVALIAFIRGPVFNYYDVDRSEQQKSRVKYYAMLNDVQGVYYQGGDFSDQSLSYLRELVPNLDEPKTIQGYTSIRCSPYRYSNYKLRNVTMGNFLGMYMDAFFKNPFLLTKNLLHRSSAYWSLANEQPSGGINYTSIHSGDENEEPETGEKSNLLKIYRSRNILSNILDNYLELMIKPIPRTFVWNYGVWTFMILLCLYITWTQKTVLHFFSFVPVITLIIGLQIANAWPVYRIGYPIFLSSLFLLADVVLQRLTNSKMTKR